MHRLLQEYLLRFPIAEKPQWSTFFTEMSVNELPYMPEIDVWCARVYSAFQKGEKICIYSDYDTDAVTATAVMYHGLRMLGVKEENLAFYAPDRFTEGYGMNTEAISQLTKEYDLIISVDCGINSVAEAQIAESAQCDLLITDHHHLSGEIPPALAVINPRLNEVYQEHIERVDYAKSNREGISPNKTVLQDNRHLISSSVCGVGVSWFCVLWLSVLYEDELQSNSTSLLTLLPYVAIGTIADCQSILDPYNRLLVRVGVSMIQQGKITGGLPELLQQTGLQDKMNQGYQLNSQDLAFTLSPILNSSGRISHAQLSISAVVYGRQDEVSELIETNQERKAMVKSIVEEVDTQAAAQTGPAIWLEGEWSKGLVGLLASRLVSRYNKPVIVCSLDEDGKVSASLRAPDGYHLPDAMEQASEYLDKFGGHPGAAGFGTSQQQLSYVKDILPQTLKKQKENGSYTGEGGNTASHIPIKAEELKKYSHKPSLIWTTVDALTSVQGQDIWSLDPFGQDFPVPLFAFEITAREIRNLSGGKHIKITSPIEVLCFSISPEVYQHLHSTKPVYIIAKPSQSVWNNKISYEFIAEAVIIEYS